MRDEHAFLLGYGITRKLQKDFQASRRQWRFERPRLAAHVAGVQPVEQQYTLNPLIVVRLLQDLPYRAVAGTPRRERHGIEAQAGPGLCFLQQPTEAEPVAECFGIDSRARSEVNRDHRGFTVSGCRYFRQPGGPMEMDE